jgi:hypothetical protein
MLMVMVLMMMVTIILERAMDVPGRGYVIMGSTLGSYPATQSVIFTANTQLIN